MNARRLSFAPRSTVLRQLRADVRTLAIRLGADAKVGDQLSLVVDELVNNAIEHGADYRQRGTNLAVQLGSSGDRLRIEFFDPEMPTPAVDELARALRAAADGMPSLENERGRGLFLLSVFLQDVEARPDPAGGLCLVGHINRQ